MLSRRPLNLVYTLLNVNIISNNNAIIKLLKIINKYQCECLNIDSNVGHQFNYLKIQIFTNDIAKCYAFIYGTSLKYTVDIYFNIYANFLL